MKKHIATALLSCTLLAAALTGCKTNASYSQVLGDAKVELADLEGPADGDFELPYKNVAFDVELEKGTVDVEIINLAVFHNEDDTNDYMELDTIYEAKGLTSGDHCSFKDDDGLIRVRVTGADGATGTIIFSEE